MASFGLPIIGHLEMTYLIWLHAVHGLRICAAAPLRPPLTVRGKAYPGELVVPELRIVSQPCAADSGAGEPLAKLKLSKSKGRAKYSRAMQRLNKRNVKIW